MHYIVDGVIKIIFDAQKFSSGFQKREIIVINDAEQPQDIKLEFVNDTCDKLDLFKAGEKVTVAFILTGNEYNGKYFTNLRGIAIGERTVDGDKKTVKSRTKKQTPQPKMDGDLNF